MNKIKLEIDDILHKAKFVAGDGLIVAHHDRVKLKLKDLFTLYSQLPLETQDFLTRKAKTQGFETYKQALQHIVSNINQVSPVEVAAAESPELTTSWMGVRSGIEVPHFGERATRSIGPELINRNLMWNDDYYQYPEWQEQLESTYDVFNLNLKKPEDKFKLFYTENGRRTPRGIVPHGGKFKTEMPFLNKRELKEKLEHREQLGIENEETWTLRDINTEYQPINTETRMKVNCLNIKHELKKDYTDSEIIDYITNFEFVD